MRYDNPVLTYHVENFGCRATQADGAGLERQFESRGLSRATAQEANLLILNTCTVTGEADRDARAAVRRARRENPLAKIIVTGCYAQRAPQEIAELPGVSAVIGNSHKHQLVEIALAEIVAGPLSSDVGSRRGNFVALSELDGTGRRVMTDDRAPLFVSDIFAHTELLAAPVFAPAFASAGDSHDHARYDHAPYDHARYDNSRNDSARNDSARNPARNETSRNETSPNDAPRNDSVRTRPNLKVQDGCDNRCSFCVIPSVRGHSRSLALGEIIREVNGLVDEGYREVVVSGINLGRWGREAGFTVSGSGLQAADSYLGKAKACSGAAPDFEFLLRAILAETKLEKLRISSVEPMDWTDSLISLVASSPRIAKHAHVPLQSGSDAVLRRMHRKYRPWHYREKIEKIRTAMPGAAIGADVMTGFPGESDGEFEATRRLIEELPLTYLHVFTYSARPGTPAAAMPNQVPVQVARERNKILRELGEEKKLGFMRSLIGRSIDAITLNAAHGTEFTEALSDNYQKIYLQGCHEANHWMTARMVEVKDGGLVGTVAAGY